MSNEMPTIKHITVTENGVMIEYAKAEERETANWIVRKDTYTYPDGKPCEIEHSTCSRCGNYETGEPNDAGMYCRRCGRFMLNGQPGAWPPREEEPEPEEDHANAD